MHHTTIYEELVLHFQTLNIKKNVFISNRRTKPDNFQKFLYVCTRFKTKKKLS